MGRRRSDGRDRTSDRRGAQARSGRQAGAVHARSRIDDILFYALLILVALAPLPLGSVYPLASAVLALAVGVLLVLHAAALARRRSVFTQTLGPLSPIIFPFLLVLAWAGLQATPWTPASWHHPLWREAGAALREPLAGAVSVDPGETAFVLLRLLCYGGIFWLALQLGRRPERAAMALIGLSVAGIAYAAYGLVDKFSGANMVLWYVKTAYRDTVTGPFVNRNSFATYAGLGLLCLSGLIVKLSEETASPRASGRFRAVQFIEALGGGRVLLVAGWAVLLTALLLTDSRGGVVSGLVGLAAFLAAIWTRPKPGRAGARLAAAAIVLGGLGLVAWSGEQVELRLADTTPQSEQRAIVYELALKGIDRSPGFGTGLGTFAEAFRFDRDDRIHGYWDKAHDTYIEDALELGIPATFILLTGLAAMLLRCAKGVRDRRRDSVYSCVGVGATILVAVHSLVDFSLAIPAIAATYALIMGVAVAQSWRTEEVVAHE